MKIKKKISIVIFILIILIRKFCFASFNIDTSKIKKAQNENSTSLYGSNRNSNTNTSANSNSGVNDNNSNQKDISSIVEESSKIKKNIDEENKNLEQIQEQLTEQLIQIQELDQKIEESENNILETEIKIYRYQSKIEQAQEFIDQYEQDYLNKQELLDKRLVAIYEYGTFSYLEMFLTSKNPIDFINNYYYAKQMAESDQQLMDEVLIKKSEIEENKSELQKKQKELGESKRELTKSEKIIENSKVVRQRLVNSLSAKEREIQNKIDIYNDEFSQINKILLEYAKGQIATSYIGGQFAWPVPGYTRITSPYGMRVHPITKAYKLHSGTDISAPLGADFVSANDGIVVTASYNTAYGNMVVVDHGGGVTTLYAHGSEILVSVGDYVKRGQKVLKVGSTGYSTGPHAHFEVRLDGITTDPIPYITNGLIPSVN